MSATRELLDAFADAFSRHDLDTVMEMMTDDCIFKTASGEGAEGKRIVGKENVREAFEATLAAMPDAQWNDAEHIIDGDRACTRWRFTCTLPDGTKVEKYGCDLLQLRDGKIWKKDTYRKQPAGGL